MEFKLTYAGELLAVTSDRTRLPARSLHVHKIRQAFHKQLQVLWAKHPVLVALAQDADKLQIFEGEGFHWIPIAAESNGAACRLDILMLRAGPPGSAPADMENRLKTIFDALRKPDGPDELGRETTRGQVSPAIGEDPFYVLLQNDNLITHVSVSTDTLLEAVPGAVQDTAVRLVISVTIRPYNVHLDNLHFT